MSRFRLAALLRVRGVQENQALGRLGRAQVDSAAAARTVRAAQEAIHLAGHASSGPASTFLAEVSARASMAAAVADAIAGAQLSRELVLDARGTWAQARGRTRAIARLEERHLQDEQREELRREQAQADELFSARKVVRDP